MFPIVMASVTKSSSNNDIEMMVRAFHVAMSSTI